MGVDVADDPAVEARVLVTARDVVRVWVPLALDDEGAMLAVGAPDQRVAESWVTQLLEAGMRAV